MSLRRHVSRFASRTAVLLTGDLLAVIATRGLLAVAVPLLLQASAPTIAAVGPLAAPGSPGSLAFPITLVLALLLTGSYGQQRGLSAVARLAAAVALATVVSTVVVAAAIGVSAAVTMNVLFGAAIWATLLAMRAVSERVLRHVWPRDRFAAAAILAGPPECFDSAVVHAVRSAGEYRIDCEYSIDPAARRDPGRLRSEVRSLLGRHDAAALLLCDALPPAEVRALLDAAIDADCLLLYPARALAIEDVHLRLVWHHDRPFLELGAPMLRPHALITKRITDVVGALALLLIAAPLMLAIAAAIRLDSPGRALFAQARAGLGGRRFDMLKFRTMYDGADAQKAELAHMNHTGDHRLFKIPQDPRVTRIGMFLRRWSLDELPQLINVLRGDMSLVGPRPFFESDFPTYEDHHFRRLDTKPGLTGLWQVSGRSDVLDFEDVVFLDKQYIERWSFWLDLSILFRTIPAVMRRTGAY
jgi:exopolysaccharide biosynthesis polyprenyl glycosylphosphotransferase